MCCISCGGISGNWLWLSWLNAGSMYGDWLASLDIWLCDRWILAKGSNSTGAGATGVVHGSAGLALPKALGLALTLIASESRLASWGYEGFCPILLPGVNSPGHG